MTDDELLVLYGSVKEMTEAMAMKTAAPDATIAQLQQLPIVLGKQTSQYIAAGVRQSIQDDFCRPIAEAVKKPMANFNQATYYARDLMRQVSEEARRCALGTGPGWGSFCYLDSRSVEPPDTTSSSAISEPGQRSA